jgi:hypothetical protein
VTLRSLLVFLLAGSLGALRTSAAHENHEAIARFLRTSRSACSRSSSTTTIAILSREGIDALLFRRDLVVAHYEALIREKGADRILY